MKRYTDFDYLKVLTILERLEHEVEKASEHYTIEIFDLDRIAKECLKVSDVLISEESFDDVNYFYILNCGFYQGEDAPEPLFFFQMGESSCYIDYYDGKPAQAEYSWRLVLANFIKKVSYLIDNEKTMKNGIHLN